MVVSLRGGIFELRTATGSEAFSLLVCLGANKFVSLSSAGSRPCDKGGGGRSYRALDTWGAWSPKKFFRPFGPQFDLKVREGGRLYPPGPSRGSATA